MDEVFYLVYVNHSGTSVEGENSYDLLFSEDPTTVFGDGWAVVPAAICSPEEKKPHISTYSLTKRIITKLKLILAQNNTMFALQDCIDSVYCLCAEDISDYEIYPENRLVIQYGESYKQVEEKLNKKSITIIDI